MPAKGSSLFESPGNEGDSTFFRTAFASAHTDRFFLPSSTAPAKLGKLSSLANVGLVGRLDIGEVNGLLPWPLLLPFDIQRGANAYDDGEAVGNFLAAFVRAFTSKESSEFLIVLLCCCCCCLVGMLYAGREE